MEFIGIDLGSQGTKIVLLNDKGLILGEEYCIYDIIFPHPFWAEQKVKDWESAVIQGLKKIVTKSKNPKEIVSIGIDAQVDGIVPINKEGDALYNAIIWMDRRAIKEEEQISKIIGKEGIFQITGCNLDASHVLPKILWLKNNIPNFKDIYKLLMPGSYLLYFLTGELGIDYSNASSTLFFDIKNKRYEENILKEFKIDVSLLPPIYPSIYKIGNLKKDISNEIGLSHQPIVAVGSGDEHASCVGAGILEEGILIDIAGTAEVVGIASTKPLLDKSHLVETHCHADPNLWLIENPGFVSGGNLRWFRDTFCMINKIPSYDELTDEASNIPPGSEGLILLPSLMGAMVPEWNSYAKGVFYGFSMKHTKGHFIRAILEASAFGVKDVAETLKNMSINISKVRVTGGGSKSKLWNQIKADVLQLPIETLITSETTSLGAALIGSVASGSFKSLKEASDIIVKIKDNFIPNKKNLEIYEKAYKTYRNVYYNLKPVFEYS